MKVVGIIAEYNPIHNGHIYHIQKAKEITNSDFCIVIMSGNFTQTGNIAIYDKFTRAKLAIANGADLVIELPTIYANSSAEHFAFGAINILNKLNIVDSICFGSECDNINLIHYICDILIEKENNIWKDINLILKTGISFATAREKILSEYLSSEQISILNKPNNILGIEYIKNIKRLKSKITPFLIQRETSEFNEYILNRNVNKKSNNNFTSATSIRESIKHHNISILKKYVPTNTYDTIKSTKPIFNDDLYNLLKYKIITTTSEQLKEIFEVTEGLENKILKEINNSNSYEEFTKNIKSKRYQLSKIRRMLINILLNITKEDIDYAINNKMGYAHILACSQDGKTLLSEISKNSDIDLITSLNKKIMRNFSEDTKKYINYDILASNIYSIITNDKIQKDYTNRL